MATISQRQLNRTFLQRQFLLERTSQGPLPVISRLLALQSQAANSPYEALWNRIEGFHPRDLDRLYEDRHVVRGTWFRSTVQTTTREDFLSLRGIHSELFAGKHVYRSHLISTFGADWSERLRAEFARAGDLTGKDISALACRLFPGEDPSRWEASWVRRALPLLRRPSGPGGRTRGSRDPWVEVESYLGRLPDPATPKSRSELVLKYLEGYGPATVADASNFLGLKGLKPIFEALNLVEHRSEDGALLYDLPEAALADPDREAPPRLMASFDHSILGHSDRTRIIDPGYSRILSGANAVFKPYILLDGRVEGHWAYSLKGSAPQVKLRYFSRPTAAQEALLLAEAESWCRAWYGTADGLSFDIGDHS